MKNEAGKYIEKNYPYPKGMYRAIKKEMKTAVNLALEQEGKEAKERFRKWATDKNRKSEGFESSIYIGHINDFINDLDKIIKTLKL